MSNNMAMLVRKIFCLGVIAVFPLFMAALMTLTFQDPVPLLYNWWLGAMLLWSAFFYGMISPLFYRKYPFVFSCLVWAGLLSFLLGGVALGYYYMYVPTRGMPLYTGEWVPFRTPPLTPVRRG